MEQLCSKCGLPGEFYPRYKRCKACVAKAQKVYAQAHREEVNAKGIAWRAANPEKSRKSSLDWYYRNKDNPKTPEQIKKRRDNGKKSRDGYQQRTGRRCPEAHLYYHRKYKYGMTREQVDQMFAVQNGLCAICEDPITLSAHIDHDHQSGKVRGMLCQDCNLGLGHFRDRTDLLERAARYLIVRIVPASLQCAFGAG